MRIYVYKNNGFDLYQNSNWFFRIIRRSGEIKMNVEKPYNAATEGRSV